MVIRLNFLSLSQLPALETLSTDKQLSQRQPQKPKHIMPLSKSNSSNHSGSFSADEQGVEISPRLEEGQDVLPMDDDPDDEPTHAHDSMMTPSNETGKRRHGIVVKALKVVLTTTAVGTIWGVTKKVSKKPTGSTAALKMTGKASKGPTVSAKSKGSKSAQPSSEPSFQPSTSPSFEPSNQPSDPPVYVQCGQRADIAGGGWTLVRHVPSVTPSKGCFSLWHPATDQLVGTDVYGVATDDDEPWSVNFGDAVPDWDQFMFATGDCTKWLVATKEAVLGGPPTPSPYDFAQRDVIMSSVLSVPHKVQMGFRAGSDEDPLISLVDYLPPDNTSPDSPKNCLILHIENSWGLPNPPGTGDADRNCVLRQNGGANVYVRQSGA